MIIVIIWEQIDQIKIFHAVITRNSKLGLVRTRRNIHVSTEGVHEKK